MGRSVRRWLAALRARDHRKEARIRLLVRPRDGE